MRCPILVSSSLSSLGVSDFALGLIYAFTNKNCPPVSTVAYARAELVSILILGIYVVVHCVAMR